MSRETQARHAKATWTHWGTLAALALLLSCVEHNPQPDKEEPTTRFQKTYMVHSKPKLDVLLVLNNNPSMRAARGDITRGLDHLARDLAARFNYRVAVTSTHLRDGGGQLLMPTTGAEAGPDAEACAALVHSGALQPILASGLNGNVGRDCGDDQGCVQDELILKLRCLTALEPAPVDAERGLEAMRLALSCDGPNATRLGSCGASELEDTLPASEFLRPDATLMVVIISDEDDCSAPASNPVESHTAICKHGVADQDGDGVPDGYRDAMICGDRAPAACFAFECDGRDAEACYAQRCEVEGADRDACAYADDHLTPIQDYVRFLEGLKARPLDQIVLLMIVGPRQYTERGDLMRFQPGEPREGCQGTTLDHSPAPYDPTLNGETLDACCPEGRCLGPVQPSCAAADHVAFPGRRYLELVDIWSGDSRNGGVGVGCPMLATPGYPDQDPSLACINICDAGFGAVMGSLFWSPDRLGIFCLDAAPVCVVPPTEIDGDLQPARPCQTPEEINIAAHYDIQIKTACGVEDCPMRQLEQALERDAWALQFTEGCPWQVGLRFHSALSPGTQVTFTYTAWRASIPADVD
ncbi:hypothetical protein KKB55_04320 [Myxococcota bacterium]|nr:hypothetical protein [Myxococcota bacterium]